MCRDQENIDNLYERPPYGGLANAGEQSVGRQINRRNCGENPSGGFTLDVAPVCWADKSRKEHARTESCDRRLSLISLRKVSYVCQAFMVCVKHSLKRCTVFGETQASGQNWPFRIPRYM